MAAEDRDIARQADERKKALTRQAISDIATEMFMERGFEAVTVAEIAEAADVSVKTVFNHFGSKEELFLDREAEIFAAITGAITDRAEGRSVTEALAAQLADNRIPAGGGWGALYDPDGAALFKRFLRTWHESPSLQARYRLSNERLADQLRAALAADVGLAEDVLIEPSALRLRRFQIKYKTGMTISVRMVELTIPPIIGAAIRFMTSAPVPVVHIMGSNPPMIAATVIILGRTR